MNLPYEWHIGWRYTRAGRAGRRNGFISFISGVSMLGIALGVAALIIVLSVMNGFQKEVRDRMLSVIAHVEVRDATGGALPDWRATAAAAQKDRRVIGAAPFVVAQALVGRGDELRGALAAGQCVRGDQRNARLGHDFGDLVGDPLDPWAAGDEAVGLTAFGARRGRCGLVSAVVAGEAADESMLDHPARAIGALEPVAASPA